MEKQSTAAELQDSTAAENNSPIKSNISDFSTKDKIEQTTFQDSADQLWANGYDCIPDEGKRPIIKNWTKGAKSKSKIQDWRAQYPYSNVGVVNVPALDIDCDHPGVIAAFGAALALFGLRTFRVGKPPRRLYPAQIPGLKKKVISKEFVDPETGEIAKLEVLAPYSQQWVAYGIHPNTQQPYSWHNGDLLSTPRENLPVLPIEDLGLIIAEFERICEKHGLQPLSAPKTEPLQERDRTPGAFGPMQPIGKLRSALYTQNPDDPHDPWVENLMSIHDGSHGSDEGKALAVEWSAGGGKFKSGEVEQRWKSFRPGGGITVLTLYKKAAATGWHYTTDPIEDFAELAASSSQHHPVGKLKVLTVDAFLRETYPPIEPLLRNRHGSELLVRGEGASFIAQGGTGKTTTLLDWCMRLAMGHSVIGFKPQGPLKVMIVQTEIPPERFQEMVRRMRQGFELTHPETANLIGHNLHVAPLEQVPDLGSADGRALLREAVEGVGADIVIADPYLTLFRSAPENDNVAVRAMLDALKYEVLLPCRCGIIIADHQSKGAAGTPGQELYQRGAVAKRDWACSTLTLRSIKAPIGQSGAFCEIIADKWRYGKKPTAPFNLRRDEVTGQLVPFEDKLSPETVTEILADRDADVTKTALTNAVIEACCCSKHVARDLIEAAVAEGLIQITQGAGNRQLCRLPV